MVKRKTKTKEAPEVEVYGAVELETYETGEHARNILIGILIFISLLFAGLLVYLLRSMLPYFSNVLQRNLGNMMFATLVLWMVVFYLIGLIAYFLIKIAWKPLLSHKLVKGEVNWWVLGTLYLMLTVIGLGFVFLDLQLGVPQLDLLVNNDYNFAQRVGEIKCSDGDGRLMPGDVVGCKLELKKEFALTNMTMNVTLILENENRSIQQMTDNSFKAENDTSRVRFDIWGVNSEGYNAHYSTEDNFVFLSKSEFEQRNERFVAYFLALLGIALFSIPSAMSSFKDLAEED